MSVPALARLAVVVGGSLLLARCGGNSTAPNAAKSIAVVNGNAQTGPGGDDLPDSLRVVVMGANGALVGATVTWAVTAGGATVSPQTSTTGANGEAAALLSL